MYIVNSDDLPAPPDSDKDPKIRSLVESIEISYLQQLVKKLSIPRHRIREKTNNEATARLIEYELRQCGLKVSRQGEFSNIIGSTNGGLEQCTMIIGAHYDSVPGSPGADDNASAVAGMIAAARTLQNTPHQIAFIAFNAEEDGLLGSTDFVNNYLMQKTHSIKMVHILEMIGFTNKAKGSQSLPPGLPIKVRDTGDFLAIVSNQHSNSAVKNLLAMAGRYVPQLHVTALELFLGIEKLLPHLLRSDHSPFWAEKIPAFMWTDTSEFRNPHYHRPSDLPDTLDYEFLRQVTQLLVAHSMQFMASPKH